MLRDDDRLRTARSVDRRRRGAVRPIPVRPSPYQPPAQLRLRPPPRDPRPFLLAAAGVLVVALVGALIARSVMAPDVSARLRGAAPAQEADTPGGARIVVPPEITPSYPGHVSTLRGLVDGATTLTANGEHIPIEAGGQFRIYLPQGTPSVQLVATDGSGGEPTVRDVVVTDTPTPSTYPETVAVHIRAIDWQDPVKREAVLQLARTGQVNAVELDIKDEAGEVGYDSDVELANITGADASAYYDPEEALGELHDLGVRVIGRMVCFLDPVVAGWAWQNGHPEYVVLDGTGAKPLANNYGSAAFTNFANPDMQQYQLDIAMEAIGHGFDEILYDYIRRPEGDLSDLTFEGLDVPHEVEIARFVAHSRELINEAGAHLGVSVFGISASRPGPTAQDVGLLAPVVDFVSPMVYPSLWGPGEYGVPDPDGMPGEIVAASLADFQRIIAGSGAAMVPWLQDFSAGGLQYEAPQIQAQIEAAYTEGSVGFILWNAHSQYHVDALNPRFTNVPR